MTRSYRSLLILGAILLLIGGVFLYSNQAAGATYTWDGEGVTDSWDDCDNWTSNTCPGASDIAAFDDTSDNNAIVEIGSNFLGSVAGVDINSGYDGIITQMDDLTIGSSNFAQDSGTWKQGTTSFDINNGDFTLSGGTFETGVSTSTVEHNFTLSGGTYTASSTSVVDLDANGQTVDDTTFTCSGGFPGLIDISKDRHDQTFTLVSGCEATTTNNVSTDSVFTNNGTLHFMGTTLDFSASNVTSGYTNNGTTTFEGSAITVETYFTQNGVFDLSGKTITFDTDGNSWDDSTLTCTGPIDATIDIDKNRYDQSFTLASGCEATTTGSVSTVGNLVNNGTLHFNGNLTMLETSTQVGGGYTNNGTTTISGSSIVIEHNFTQNGVFDLTGVTLTFDANNQTNDDSTLSCSGVLGGTVAVTKDRTDQTFVLGSGCEADFTNVSMTGYITINGTYDTQGNTLTATGVTVGSGGTLQVAGDETLTSPTLNSNSAVEYTGASTYSSLIAGTDYENISFTGGGTYNITSSLTVNDDFISTNDSNFNQTSGSVTLDGGGQTVTGTSTFYQLTKSVTSPATLTFGANQTQTVSNSLTLTGIAGGRLALRSTSEGTQWNIDGQVTSDSNIKQLSVEDSNNTSGSDIYCSPGCYDDTGNSNWIFSPRPQGRETWRLNGGVRFGGGVTF